MTTEEDASRAASECNLGITVIKETAHHAESASRVISDILTTSRCGNIPITSSWAIAAQCATIDFEGGTGERVMVRDGAAW